MPQLDIYRACDEISIVLIGLTIIYILMVIVTLPLTIQRIGIMKIQNERKIQEIEKLKNYYQRINLAFIEKNYIFKL